MLSILLLISIATIASVAINAYLRDVNETKSKLAERSQILSTPIGPLEYALAGDGQPVLVLHGAAGGFDQAIEMTKVLVPNGFQILAPSRFGYLRSISEGYVSPETQADAYVDLLDSMKIDRVPIIAISAGAWSAIQFAIRHPDRTHSLVLLVPANHLPQGVKIYGGTITSMVIHSDFLAWIAYRAMELSPGFLTKRLLGVPPSVLKSASASEKARLGELVKNILPVNLRLDGMRQDILTAAMRQDLRPGKIHCPLLIISAEDDPFHTAARARKIAHQTKHAKLILYRDGGHALVGHLADAVSEVLSFLKLQL